jgi:hypothetical protein
MKMKKWIALLVLAPDLEARLKKLELGAGNAVSEED